MNRKLVASLAASCLCLAGLALVGGCCNDKCSSGGAAMACYNKTCCCGKAMGNSKYCSSYKGENLCFCCQACKEHWDKMSDADKAAQFAKMKKGA